MWQLPVLQKVSHYQVDVLGFYVLQDKGGEELRVPLHSRIIWKIPGNEKGNQSLDC